MRKLIAECGWNVIGEAADGDDAVAKYQSLKPDVVTMDITLPGKTGLETLAEIMALDKDARIIMCTALAEKSYLVQAMQMGAKEFLLKPVGLEKLRHAVEKVVKPGS